MRVTNNMMTNNLLYNVNKNLEYMTKKQDELATGKRVHVPSDDPVLASKILARSTDLAELEQYAKNTRDAQGWLEITEKALEDNGNVFQRLRELTVQAASGTNTAEETKKIKLEIEQLKSQLITNANTTFAGRYVFSGFETNSKLMNKDGSYAIDVDKYSIDNKPKVKYEVSVGESLDVMTSGLDVYGLVAESNIMTKYFPGGTKNTPPLIAESIANSSGIASSKSKAVRSFTLDTNNTGIDLDINIGGTNYVIDESTFDGSVIPLKKEEIINKIKSSPGGGGVLGDVAEVYFDKNDNLVIEAKNYGATAMTPSVPANYTVTVGVPKTEATLSGVEAMPAALTAADQAILKERSVNVIVNNVSKKVLPDPLMPITTPAEYAAALQSTIDKEFGSGKISVTAPGDILTFSTLSTPDGEKPMIQVDYPRTKTSEMMRDIDELIGYLDTGDHSNIGDMLTKIDKHMNNMLSLRADIGARTNRMEMITKNIAANNVSFTKLLSDAEDADMSEVIMKLKNAENVYKASLSTGSRVIQPSLVDFIR